MDSKLVCGPTKAVGTWQMSKPKEMNMEKKDLRAHITLGKLCPRDPGGESFEHWFARAMDDELVAERLRAIDALQTLPIADLKAVNALLVQALREMRKTHTT